MSKRIARIAVGAALFSIALGLSHSASLPYGWISVTFFAASYIVVGSDVALTAFKGLLKGNALNESFLMSLASLGAFFIGSYSEGVAVMLFYQVGELFQSYAVAKSRRSIAKLMDIRPDHANAMRNGELVKCQPDEIRIGDRIVIKPGERVPLDARIIEGESLLDSSALTGESTPQRACIGDSIPSGCVNMNGTLVAEALKEAGESTASRILELVENASEKKAKSERFITRFARIYTPAVVGLAALLAVAPPLLFTGETFGVWLYRALTFLVVSCPCALVISVPMSFFGGICGAARTGILVKGGNYLEALAKTECVVFDKTGTLTQGVFELQRTEPAEGFSREKLLELVAHAELYSDHPASMALKRAYGEKLDASRVADAKEERGYGVLALVDGKRVAVGNAKLMEKLGVAQHPSDSFGTVVHVAIEGRYAGRFEIADKIKADAANAVKSLRKLSVSPIVMLTGDAKRIASKVADSLGLDEAHAELLPDGKIAKLEELFNRKNQAGSLAFVGDGINDAPSLARADVGVAMGGLGSEAAIEAADVVIMSDEPSKLSAAIRISRKTLAIATQNIVLALTIKAAVLILCAFGIAVMWEAVFSDVGVTLMAVANSMRAIKAEPASFQSHEAIAN